GLAQRLFRDFAFTLSTSLLVSLLTALALLPAVIVLTQRSRPREGFVSRAWAALQRWYRAILAVVLKWKPLVFIAALVALSASVGVIGRQGFELLPDVNRGQLSLRLVLPADSSVERVEHAVDSVEAVLKRMPAVEAFVTEGGKRGDEEMEGALEVGRPNEATIKVRLHPQPGGALYRDHVTATLRSALRNTPDAQVEFRLRDNVFARALGGAGNPELFRLTGDDLAVLSDLSKNILSRMKGAGTLTDVDSQGDAWIEQERILVDRYKAAAQRLTVKQTAEAVRLAVQGKSAGKLIQGDRDTEIIVRLKPEHRKTVKDLGYIPLLGTNDDSMSQPAPQDSTGGSTGTRHQERRGGGQDVVLLGDVAQVVRGGGPREILRSDGRRVVVFTAGTAGQAFSRAYEDARMLAEAQGLPEGYEIRPGAERFELVESFKGLAVAAGLALMLVYVVLAIQFESFKWPLVVILAVPMTTIGPALVFAIRPEPVNVLHVIGGIVLLGVVVNNAIIQVTYTNQLRSTGLPGREALLTACAVRLRPILISSLTTALGILPVCAGWGGAAGLRQSLAITVVTGLLSSLFFTLFLVPALYDLWSGRDERLQVKAP
ncbi:MAG: efflux RND transporter permease subunit, partial [Pseudomonadota bacterium]